MFKNISVIFASNYYSVPDYQREYEWSIAENSTLLLDTFSLLENPDVNIKHFLGAIVTIPYEANNGVSKSFELAEYAIPTDEVLHLVDGQQRLTSLSLLITSFRNMLKEDETVNINIKANLISALDGLLLGQHFREIDFNKAPRLILNGNTGHCYNNDVLSIRDDNVNHSLRGAKRIAAAKAYYDRALRQKKEELLTTNIYPDAITFYRRYMDVLTRRIILVEIECDASSDAFQVFDSLNGKGLDLTAADRIKNIVLSWAAPADRAVQKWDSLVAIVSEKYLVSFFVALFFFASCERVSKNKLPEKFRNEYSVSARNNFSNFYSELHKCATIYGQLRQARTGQHEVDERLLDFQQLGMDQVFVLLYAVVRASNDSNIYKRNDFNDMMDALTSLVVRMQICDMSMNTLDKLFKKCIEILRDPLRNIQDVTTLLSEEKKRIGDELFESKFSAFSTSDNKLSEFYLRHIEQYLQRTQNNSRFNIPRNLTVEHIIPQTLDSLNDWYGNTPVPTGIEEDFTMEYVQNIGNKALLYGDDNSAAGNNTYPSKLTIYQNGRRGQDNGTPVGTFVLISNLVNHYPSQFLDTDVLARAKELAAYAREIW